MRTCVITVVVALCLVGAFLLGRATVQPRIPATTFNADRQTRQQWVERCWRDFQAVKPGMTRNQVERLFSVDGGLQPVSPTRFTHPDCPCFKIEVWFAANTVDTVSRAFFEPVIID